MVVEGGTNPWLVRTGSRGGKGGEERGKTVGRMRRDKTRGEGCGKNREGGRRVMRMESRGRGKERVGL